MDQDSPVILFDGVCNLCNTSVQRILKNERKPTFKFASLQSNFGRKMVEKHGGNPDELNSIILIKNGKAYYKTRAIFRIAAKLKFPYPLIYIFWPVPYFIRDIVYDWVGRNRYKWYGKKDECWLPTPDLKERFIEM